MRITHLESQLLRLPLGRPVLPLPGEAPRREHIFLLVVYLDTDAGHRGLGFAPALDCGRALKVIADDDLAALVTGEDPLDHARLFAKFRARPPAVGLVAQVYSAVDLALWDIKGKAAGLPLYKLLGGAREAAPAYVADAGWLWMSPEEIITAARGYLDQGLLGIKMEIGSPDPETDAGRLSRVRDALGESVWLAVDAEQRYDLGTAVSVGHFLEEEIAPDWFENPLPAADVEGHARLAERVETPLAIGATLFSAGEFTAFLEQRAVDVVRPDVTRLGGITPWLQVAALAEVRHRTVVPHLLPEVGVHLACGLPNVQTIEYTSWLAPAFVEGPAIVQGKLVPSRRPGLGLEIKPDALEKYRVEL